MACCCHSLCVGRVRPAAAGTRPVRVRAARTSPGWLEGRGTDTVAARCTLLLLLSLAVGLIWSDGNSPRTLELAGVTCWWGTGAYLLPGCWLVAGCRCAHLSVYAARSRLQPVTGSLSWSGGRRVPTMSIVAPVVNGVNPPLRILCIHGFCQSASTFKGRTAALRSDCHHNEPSISAARQLLILLSQCVRIG